MKNTYGELRKCKGYANASSRFLGSLMPADSERRRKQIVIELLQCGNTYVI